MSRTTELLSSLKEALLQNKISVTDFPLDDVQVAVETEIGLYQNTFLEEQYEDVLCKLEVLYVDVSKKVYDKDMICLYLDSCILTLSMISQAVLSLMNREYWEKMHPEYKADEHVKKIIDYIDVHREVKLIPYDFMEEYASFETQVYWDDTHALPFLMHGDRKMFFPAEWSNEDILSYYGTLLAEQDERSPHSYQKSGYEVRQGDVVLDAGAAEGIFGLNCVTQAKKIYMVECDEMWLRCLGATFEDEILSGKVILVDKYLSEKADDENITIDVIFDNETVNYLKMDIEGYEKQALSGAKETLRRAQNIRMAICSYHCHEDELWIKEFLRQMHYETTTSDGYMCPDWTPESILKAQLRRGVVFGRR